MDAIRARIRDVPDFPKKGIVFKDITPVLQDAATFKLVVDALAARWSGERIAKVVGIESRGFIFAAPLAYALGAGLTIVRKPGKLPYERISEAYALEYGQVRLLLRGGARVPERRASPRPGKGPRAREVLRGLALLPPAYLGEVTGSLQFLGTAGARHVVASQARHSGGLVWRAAGATLWVDPGPGALVRALAATPPLDPAQVTALLLTHRHLDHAGDATAAVEAMTGGGFHARGALYAPADALDEEPVVFRYAQRFPRQVVRLRAGGAWKLAEGLTLETPLSHDHGVETYGYRLTFGGFTAAHVVDTFWMDALPDAYAGADLLIVNTTRRSGRSPPPRSSTRTTRHRPCAPSRCSCRLGWRAPTSVPDRW